MENNRDRIILVDDNKANLTLGRNLLKMSYEVFPAQSSDKLFEILDNIQPNLILLDVEMPEVNGFEVIKKLKGNNRFEDIPVIFLTAKSDEMSEMEGFDLGAVDYVSKPFSGPLLLKRIECQLLLVKQRKELIASRAALQDYTDNLEVMVREKTAEVVNLQNAVLATVADLVEFRDRLTGGHIARTQHYLRTIIDKMLIDGVYAEEINAWDLDSFLPSAQLHDVGKIAITDLILNKPGKLSPEEFEIMKTHVPEGVNAIEKIMEETKEQKFLNHALLFAGSHHEKWDGSGYPAGIKGADIPLQGRLMAIADVYDALISRRSYKEAVDHETACKIVEAGAGNHFDPALVEVFRKVKGRFQDIAREYSD